MRSLVSYNHSHSMEKIMEYYTLNIVLWNVLDLYSFDYFVETTTT